MSLNKGKLLVNWEIVARYQLIFHECRCVLIVIADVYKKAKQVTSGRQSLIESAH